VALLRLLPMEGQSILIYTLFPPTVRPFARYVPLAVCLRLALGIRVWASRASLWLTTIPLRDRMAAGWDLPTQRWVLVAAPPVRQEAE